mmetsp:Transcript_64029/g.166465  ORF Transcript_64029/g.166465 Transcript_64029/m.166465 type:complete len:134 (+) Transcript_64029:3-404(+)
MLCRVRDGGDFGGEAQLAGEGRVDVMGLRECGEQGGSQVLTVELYAPEGEDSDAETASGASSRGSLPTRGSPSVPDTPERPTWPRPAVASSDTSSGSLDGRIVCGSLELRVTLIDMSGMHAQQKKPLHELVAA